MSDLQWFLAGIAAAYGLAVSRFAWLCWRAPPLREEDEIPDHMRGDVEGRR